MIHEFRKVQSSIVNVPKDEDKLLYRSALIWCAFWIVSTVFLMSLR